MATEFELILEDFEAELVAIEGMINSLSATGSVSPARARIAGANAATLLLAATFEEFVRQEVKAAFVARAATASGMKDFPPKIAGVVWRRSLERLSRESLGSGLIDHSQKMTAAAMAIADMKVWAQRS